MYFLVGVCTLVSTLAGKYAIHRKPTTWTAAVSLGSHLREVNLFLTICNYFSSFSPVCEQHLPNWILAVFTLVACLLHLCTLPRL